jgi:hypothetical protein
VGKTIEAAEEILLPDWFIETQQRRRNEYMEIGIDGDRILGRVDEWPRNVKPNKTFYKLEKTSARGIAIGLVPTREPWEVPAFLGFGGWNEAPPPEAQCAVQKFWQKLYGAVPQ